MKGKGTIQLTDKLSCDNVYWVEGLNYNLLSILQPKKLGYIVEFHNRKAKIHDVDGKLIGIDEKTRSNLFYLDLSN